MRAFCVLILHGGRGYIKLGHGSTCGAADLWTSEGEGIRCGGWRGSSGRVTIRRGAIR